MTGTARPAATLATLGACALLFARPFADDGAGAPLAPAAVKPLEKVAREIAKGGRGPELDELLEILRRAGMDGEAQQKLAAACRQDVVKAKKVAATLPFAA